MGIFNIDSPLMRGMSKVADLLILNLLVILTCIPIITIGASMSAMHYVLIKMSKNEGTYVTGMYFKSFKENFAQGTVLWFVNILAIILFVVDMLLFFSETNTTLPLPVFIVVVAVGILFMMTCMYFYPLQARFVNPVPKTIRNAFFVMVLNFPQSIVMLLLYAIPTVIVVCSAGLMQGAFYLMPAVLLFGFTAPGYGAALLYKNVFRKIEPKEEEVADDMDFHVVMDDENEAENAQEEENTQEAENAQIVGNEQNENEK